jgi:hypothetical protein
MRGFLIGVVAVVAGVATQAGAAPSTAQLERLLERADLGYEKTDSGALRVLYEFDDGRSQLVFLMPQGQFDDVDVVEIYSPVMRLRDDTVPAVLGRRLLEMNGERKITYFGVEDVEGSLMVFCYHNTPSDKLDAKTLETLLLAVSTFADEMEKEQLGVSSDEF